MPGRGDIEEAEGRRSQRFLERAAALETRALYRLADQAYLAFSCPASGECCQLTKTGRPPWLWPSEWRLLEALGPVPPARADGGCPFLDASGVRCAVYADRALGCRTFFCTRRKGPAREPAELMAQLLGRLEAVNQRAWPDEKGPRPMLELAAAAR